MTNSCFAQNNLPFPIIFVHGLADSDDAFEGCMEYLRDHDNLGEINVFDILLNADNNSETSLMFEDVKWEDFTYDDTDINVGRRNYASNIDDYVHEWTESNIFAVNFQEESIEGASGFFNDNFDQSNEAAIFKQGYALNKIIQEVLDYTGAEKVILVGHSMGGLCIREYLQRTDENDVHVNWIDPSIPDGHKIARVSTFGTPHLGSNTSLDPTKSEIPDELGVSEANRDLLWEYDSYNFCEGYPQGIYMFGGNENCIASEEGLFGNATFDNVDVNCNGSQTDDIVGINESPESFSYNSEMPLPTNIKYTYMTSIWIGWNVGLTGDGAVDINRQWLYNDYNIPVPIGITDTLLTDVFHTDEGHDYFTIIRGIDEPKLFNLAYELNLNHEIIGYITYQQNGVELDEDIFKLSCEGYSSIAFVYNVELSSVNTLEFYDINENLILSQEVDAAIDTVFVNVPEFNQEVFVKLIGTATSTSWENPYHIYCYPEESTGFDTENKTSVSIFPNPSDGILKVLTSYAGDYQLSIYNSQTKLVYKSTKKSNFDVSFLKDGVYTVKIEIENSVIIKRIIILK